MSMVDILYPLWYACNLITQENIMSCTIAKSKTAIIQIGSGLVIVAVSLVSKSVLITLVGMVVLGLGIRGIVNICKDK